MALAWLLALGAPQQLPLLNTCRVGMHGRRASRQLLQLSRLTRSPAGTCPASPVRRRPLRHYYLGEAVEVGQGEAVALAGEPDVLSSLASVLLGAGVCGPAQLRALRSPGSWGDGPAGAAALPEGATRVEGVERLLEGAGGGWCRCCRCCWLLLLAAAGAHAQNAPSC